MRTPPRGDHWWHTVSATRSAPSRSPALRRNLFAQKSQPDSCPGTLLTHALTVPRPPAPWARRTILQPASYHYQVAEEASGLAEVEWVDPVTMGILAKLELAALRSHGL